MTCDRFVHHLAHFPTFHPSLASLTNDPLPVPNVPTAPLVLTARWRRFLSFPDSVVKVHQDSGPQAYLSIDSQF
jgi:hypothetical protein